ncbi:hypothetical protein FZC35_00155 [Candidatus Cytomitobacter indipagum]|uniref:HU family DNA-binding protein n=1 Tax=Candidatus Cytomitobacter indipagum TaxID=2601575 RepID=A0A5C0UCW1_9PROT|nr:HU family DNA-binding protein [Candidatus Cytomitobacter indipagum]QEK37808.1 hypothetical protein FZC35_00155 [Candidatus Cytomitobacter indipagum]
MNYTQLKQAIAKKLHIKINEVDDVLSAFKLIITESMLDDDAVSWGGFFKSEPKWREPAIKTNPRTGEKQEVEGKYDAKITFTKTFRTLFNQEKALRKSK